MLSLNPNERPSISEVFNILKEIKPGEVIPGSGTAGTSKKPVLRFGPGFKPSGCKGVETTTSKTVEPKPPMTSSSMDEERPKKTGGLRGSGLKIADK